MRCGAVRCSKTKVSKQQEHIKLSTKYYDTGSADGMTNETVQQISIHVTSKYPYISVYLANSFICRSLLSLHIYIFFTGHHFSLR